MKILVSACLVGINCRYNGGSNEDKDLISALYKSDIVPVCPEQLGGLTTPRKPIEIRDGRAVNEFNEDFTEAFEKGAEETLKIAMLTGCNTAVLKARSPSCGVGKIYNGNFEKKLINGNGVTTQLLIKNNIKVYNEENYLEILKLSEEGSSKVED